MLIFGGFILKNPIIPESSLIFFAALFALCSQIHFVHCIIQQFTRVLGIQVFRIGNANPGPTQIQELKKQPDADDDIEDGSNH